MTGLGSYGTGWLEDVDLDELERFRLDQEERLADQDRVECMPDRRQDQPERLADAWQTSSRWRWPRERV